MFTQILTKLIKKLLGMFLLFKNLLCLYFLYMKQGKLESENKFL